MSCWPSSISPPSPSTCKCRLNCEPGQSQKLSEHCYHREECFGQQGHGGCTAKSMEKNNGKLFQSNG